MNKLKAGKKQDQEGTKKAKVKGKEKGKKKTKSKEKNGPGFFDLLSIKVKLSILSGFLLLALVCTNLFSGYNTISLHRTMLDMQTDIEGMRDVSIEIQSVIKEEGGAAHRLESIENAQLFFGELRYWLTDLSASWLNESESNAEESKAELEKTLKKVSTYAPEEVLKIQAHVEKIYDLSIQAVDSFVDENRVQGNALLAEARREALAATAIFEHLVEQQKEYAKIAAEKALSTADQTIANANEVIAKTEEAAKTAEGNIAKATLVMVMAMIAAVVITLSSITSLIVPINRIVASMKELAEGNVDIQVPPVTKTEMGRLAEALQVFKDNRIETNKLSAERDEQTGKIEARNKELEKLTDNFDINVSGFIEELSSSLGSLQGTAGDLSKLAENGAQQSTELAAASESATSNVNVVSSTTEELSASIAEINTQLTNSNRIAKEAVEKSDIAGKGMETLRQKSESIGDVISLISDIAEQTNLLALNATIEAARAGEMGKGFAVVATEVKNLATQTANATADIGEQITQIQQETIKNVQGIEDVSSTIHEMEQIMTAVSAGMEEQGAAVQEIVRSMQSALDSTTTVSETSSHIKTASGDTDKAASVLKEAANDLLSKNTALRDEVEVFLANIKAN